MSCSRRHFLHSSAFAAAATVLGNVPALAAPKRPAADFSFVVITDLHYRDQRCGEWCEQRLLPSIRRLRPQPAFVMLGGDLTELGTADEMGAVKEIFATLKVPVRQVIGNHDYTEDGKSRAAYEAAFGKRLNYRFDHGSCQFLALDSTQGRSVYRTKVPAETLAWLDAQLPQLSRNKPLVLLTHFPMGRNWLRPVNAHTVLERLRPYPLQAALSGHWHGLTDREEKGIHLSTGRCASWWRNNHDGSDQKGYALAHVHNGAVTHEFVAV